MKRRPHIIGIGLRCLDIVQTLDVMPDWKSGGWVDDFSFQGGGPVGTALVAASRLGARTGFIGTIGDDDIGAIKKRTLVDYGVDISHAITLPCPENQVAFVYVHKTTGERIFSRNAHMRDYPIGPSSLDCDYVTGADLLHLDGFYPEASLAAACWMRKAGKTVVLDLEKSGRKPITPQMRELVSAVNILICGQGATRELSGIDDVPQAMRAVLSLGPRVVVETAGADGCVTMTKTRSFFTPTFAVKAVNTTGAGDVFHGAYIVGLLLGWDLERVAHFAAATAALTCTKIGGPDRIPDFQAVRTFLQEQHIELPEHLPLP